MKRRLIASSSAQMARWTSFFTMSSYSPFTSASSSLNRFFWSSLEISEWWSSPSSSSLRTMKGLTQPPSSTLTSALEILSWMYRGEIPSMPSRWVSSRSSLMLSSVYPGRDVLAPDPLRVVVALVDLHLVVEPHVVRDVDLQRAVAEGFHELVVLEPLVLRLVGVADDQLVDVGLGEFLGLDGVLLRRAQEVVQE